MKLSTKGRYGVKAMVELALCYGGDPVSIKVIAEKQKISEYYLEQLFAPLRKANIITSTRGAQGGYILSKPPKDISVFDIIEILEGPIEISHCLDEGVTCDNTECCATRLLWSRLKQSIDDVTKSTSLQDIVDDFNSMNRSE